MSLAEHLVGQAGELILALDDDGRIMAAWGQDPLSRQAAKSLVDRPVVELWPQGGAQLLAKLDDPGVRDRGAFDMPLGAADETTTVRVRVSALDGEYAGARVLFVDALQERFASASLVQHLMHQHPDYILVVNEAGELIDSNTAVVRDFAAGLAARISLDDLFTESARRQYRDQVLPALARAADWSGHSVWLSADGQRMPMQMHAVRLAREQAGGEGHIAIFARDTSAEQRVEAALRESERTLRNILDGTPVALLGLEMSGDIVSANQRAGALLGRDAGDLIGMNLHRFMDDDGFEEATFRLEYAYSEDTLERWNARVERRDGTALDVAVTVRGVIGRGGHRILLAAFEDVTDYNRLQAEITYQLDHDVLTDLLNRRGLERVLKQRGADDDMRGFVFHLNIDYFRYINELIGQSEADTVLWRIADMLRLRLRDEGAAIARVGADEFVVVRFDTDEADAREHATGLLKALEQVETPTSETALSLTGCVGYAPLGERGWLHALTAAGSACYAAKAAARGSIREYTAEEPGDSQDARTVMAAAQSVRKALSQEAVLLYAQPIYRTAGATSGQPHCFEILARFRDRDRATFPTNLLSAAERFGLMDSFDRYMVSRALEWMAEHENVVRQIDHVAINLSGNSVSDPQFQEFLACAVQDAAIEASKLCFEITETIAVRNIAQARRLMRHIGALGCRFSLDDFGAGMCSFQYLRDLPADYVKIDGSFVQGMEDDPVRHQLVRSINETAQVLGKQTVAEFVDSPAALQALADLGVDMVQGWLFSPAVPIDEIPALMERGA
ncbi:MAG: EAL domain-containing protein [Pseudomonadota bacterium]|nr:EAL domain-containing protein [Pseudomonadota bacterium]